MTTKALVLLNTTYNTMTEDSGGMIAGCRWILGGKLESGEGVLQRLFVGKGGG